MPLAPRLAPGRPNALALDFSSATSRVLPSRLTKRQLRYQAPRVAGVAIGWTIWSCNSRNGSQLRRVRACEMPDLPATLMGKDGFINHCTPSSRQRSTSR